MVLQVQAGNKWLRQTGSNVANSDTRTDNGYQSNNPYVVAAWDFLATYNAGDYVELIWSTDNINIGLDISTYKFISPAIPSLIVYGNASDVYSSWT